MTLVVCYFIFTVVKGDLKSDEKNQACMFVYDRQIAVLCNIYAPRGILMIAFMYLKPSTNWTS